MKNFNYYFLLLFTIASCTILRRPAEDKLPIMDLSSRKYKKKQFETPMRMCFIPGKSRIVGPTDEQFDDSKVLTNRKITLTPFFMFETPMTIGDYKKYLSEFDDYLIRLYNEVQDPLQSAKKIDNTKNNNSNITKDNDKNIVISTVEFYEILKGKFEYKSKINQKSFMAACKKKIKPDQNVFTKGLKYQFEDKVNYYDKAIFDEYPVIFVNYHQAEWYLKYLTFVTNEYRKKNKMLPYPEFELPSVAQWEHAAADPEKTTPQRFSWGKNPKGEQEKKFANFKYFKGEYQSHLQHVNRSSAYRNNNGLYDMQGNVNEWTKDSYSSALNATISGLDPVYIDKNNPNKVIKGGSWRDPYSFLEISYNGCVHENTQSSTISFRPIMRYYGDY